MKTSIAIMIAVFLSCPGLCLAADSGSTGGSATHATTVKSSKSNSSERALKAEDPAKKDAETDDAMPATKARKNAAHDSPKSSINNVR